MVEKKWDGLNDENRRESLLNIEIKRKTWASLSSMEPMDENYRRITYCRYADDFLIGVIGSKADAERVKNDIREFLMSQLKLELSVEKTMITHSAEKARFLGYDITLTKTGKEFVRRNGARFRRSAGTVKLYVPKEKWINNLLSKKILFIQKDDSGKERWMPVARSSFVNRKPLEIVSTYNAEIRGIYNYYAMASNVSVLSKYRYVMEYSMYKTFACKYRCSMIKVKMKFTRNKVFSIPYITPGGVEKQISFNHGGFCKKNTIMDNTADMMPKPTTFYKRPNELILRILICRCELCGKVDDLPKVYQVKSLNDLNKTKEWEALMLKKRRKTLVVCHDCYDKIHSKVDI